jgi:hypothetical protein
MLVACAVVALGVFALAGTPAEEQRHNVEFHMKDIAGQINTANTSKTDSFKISYMQGALADIDRLLAYIADAQSKHTWVAGLKYQIAGQVATDADVVASLRSTRKDLVAAIAQLQPKQAPRPSKASPPADKPAAAPKAKGGECVKKGAFCGNTEECCDGHAGGPMICGVFGNESTTCGPCSKAHAACTTDNDCCGYKFGNHDGPMCVEHVCGKCYPKGHRCNSDSVMCDGYCCSGQSKQVKGANVCQ